MPGTPQRWRRYAATSVQDLVDEFGVQRGSLYAAFGDEHDLYLKAVTLYDAENREHLQAVLQDDPVLPALRRTLLDPSALTGAPDRAQGRRGCLVGNITVELVPGDDAARALAAAAYDGFIRDRGRSYGPPPSTPRSRRDARAPDAAWTGLSPWGVQWRPGVTGSAARGHGRFAPGATRRR
jgi:AcrR family transcriptional regulator